MSVRLQNRLDKVEAAARGRLPVSKALVVIPALGGGYSALGQHFDSPEEAMEAFPDHQPRVVIRIVDARRTA